MRSVGVAFCGGSRVEEGRPKKKELKEGGGGGRFWEKVEKGVERKLKGEDESAC